MQHHIIVNITARTRAHTHTNTRRKGNDVLIPCAYDHTHKHTHTHRERERDIERESIIPSSPERSDLHAHHVAFARRNPDPVCVCVCVCARVGSYMSYYTCMQHDIEDLTQAKPRRKISQALSHQTASTRPRAPPHPIRCSLSGERHTEKYRETRDM